MPILQCQYPASANTYFNTCLTLQDYVLVVIDDGIVHTNEFTPCIAQLVQVLICGYAILVFKQATQANSACPSLHG